MTPKTTTVLVPRSKRFEYSGCIDDECHDDDVVVGDDDEVMMTR